ELLELLDHVGLRGCYRCRRCLGGLLRLELGDPGVPVVVLLAALLHVLACVVGNTAHHRSAHQGPSSSPEHVRTSLSACGFSSQPRCSGSRPSGTSSTGSQRSRARMCSSGTRTTSSAT